MELGIVGLGKMGFNMAECLRLAGHTIDTELSSRLRSCEEKNFTDRMLSVMRHEFGGHAVKRP